MRKRTPCEFIRFSLNPTHLLSAKCKSSNKATFPGMSKAKSFTLLGGEVSKRFWILGVDRSVHFGLYSTLLLIYQLLRECPPSTSCVRTSQCIKSLICGYHLGKTTVLFCVRGGSNTSWSNCNCARLPVLLSYLAATKVGGHTVADPPIDPILYRRASGFIKLSIETRFFVELRSCLHITSKYSRWGETRMLYVSP